MDNTIGIDEIVERIEKAFPDFMTVCGKIGEGVREADHIGVMLRSPLRGEIPARSYSFHHLDCYRAEGTEYKVTEAEDSRFASKVTDGEAEGTLEEDGSVTFTNTRKVGALEIRKTVDSPAKADPEKDFHFTVILSDPVTMAHYPAPYDEAGTKRWLDWCLDCYARYGFGLWAMDLKETGRFGPDRDRASEIDAGTAHMRTDRNVDFIREITEEVQAFKAKEEN